MEVEEIKGVGLLNKNVHVDGKCLEKKGKKKHVAFFATETQLIIRVDVALINEQI